MAFWRLYYITARCQYLAMLWQGSPRRLDLLSQHPIYGTVSSTARIQGPKNQVELGEAPSTLTCSEQLANVLLPLLETSCSIGLEVPVSEEGMLPKEDTTVILLNWKWKLTPGHFGFLLPLNQQAKKGLAVMAGMSDPDYQADMGLLFHNAGKKEYVQNVGDPL